MDLATCKSLFQTNEKALLDEFFKFLSFPSISADPAFRPDLKACAKWLQNNLEESGFQVDVWNAEDAPILFAHDLRAGPDKPTLLLYNHYDVQPVDPLELWHHDPFKAEKKGNTITARGAQDNKGQCFYVMTALKMYLKEMKRFPINIKWIIEGEEESGSHALSKILEEKKKELECDSLMIVDLGMKQQDVAAITLGTRGLISLEVEVTGTNADVHSGVNGGLIYNPLHALVEILAKLRGHDGHILVPHFYDQVRMPADEEIDRINFSFDEEAFVQEFGAAATGGEKVFLPLQRLWLRPTVEINGVGGGYQGAGGKTVIPARAFAKITCRLVPDQDPATIAKLVKTYIESLQPEGVRVQVTIHEGMGKAVRVKSDSPIMLALEKACEEVFKKPPEYILEGASIPVVSGLMQHLDCDLAMWGLGLNSDKIHSPNEHFGWDRIEKGYLTIVKTIDALASFKKDS